MQVIPILGRGENVSGRWHKVGETCWGRARMLAAMVVEVETAQEDDDGTG